MRGYGAARPQGRGQVQDHEAITGLGMPRKPKATTRFVADISSREISVGDRSGDLSGSIISLLPRSNLRSQFLQVGELGSLHNRHNFMV